MKKVDYLHCHASRKASILQVFVTLKHPLLSASAQLVDVPYLPVGRRLHDRSNHPDLMLYTHHVTDIYLDTVHGLNYV